MPNDLSLTTNRRVPGNTQTRNRNLARGLTGKVVVVRTLFGTFTGCLLSVEVNTIRLRVFSGIDRQFIAIRIPIGIILDIFRFPC